MIAIKGGIMGDKNRGQIFAQYIVRQFPKAKNILDVAGGKGQVARKLANKRRHVTVIDAKPRFEGRCHKRIQYQAGRFTDDYAAKQVPDLVVGMHPDEATSEIVLYAVKHRIPFAVVPCCIKGRHSAGLRYSGWLNKLIALARQGGYVTNRHVLKISGKNDVLAGRPR